MNTLQYLVLGTLLAYLSACTAQPNQQAAGNAEDVSALKGQPENAILFLQGEEKILAFRNAKEISHTRIVSASPSPLLLPTAKKPLSEFSFSANEQSYNLDAIFKRLNIAGLIAVKDGEVLLERYALGNNEKSRWISFSVAKSVVSLLYGVAVKDGYITNLDAAVTDYLPQLNDSAYAKASIRDLLQMASGVAWNEDYADPQSDVADANYATLPLYEHLRRKEQVAEPGERFNYNTAETNLAGTLLRSAIGNNLSTYLQNKIWQPFGMEDDAYWQLTEPGGGEFGGCCINATLRDYARIGLFALSNGRLADGTRVLPDTWMAESTAPSPAFDGYGYFWWLLGDGSYQAMGIFGQGIYINPKTNTVIAIHSAREQADNEEDWALQDAFLQALDARLQAR